MDESDEIEWFLYNITLSATMMEENVVNPLREWMQLALDVYVWLKDDASNYISVKDKYSSVWKNVLKCRSL